MSILKTTTRTITKTIIEVTEESLKERMADSFRDVFADYDITQACERDNYYADWNRFTDNMEQMDRGLFAQVFKEGYTYMLMNFKDQEVIEKFHQQKNPDAELEVHVLSKGTTYVIKSDELSY
jgi:hypothetical protein